MKAGEAPTASRTEARQRGQRTDGFLPLEDYAALGDGRSVALSGADGSIDWWCAPNLDSPPLFDRLLSPEKGGCFIIAPDGPFTVTQRYLPGSNVHETIFTAADGEAALVESLNSNTAGRLPWCELARRVEGRRGIVRFRFLLRIGTRAETVSPYLTHTAHGVLFHAGALAGCLRRSAGVTITREEDGETEGSFTVEPGTRETLAIVAGENEPLVLPDIAAIDQRIDVSHEEWREWSRRLHHDGPYRDLVLRNALALKLLLYSPTGAIAAAATTSLPEGVGGPKNWDYRYAWIRDAGYTIKAFLRIGAEAEAKAALTWLMHRLCEHGPHVMYKLDGHLVPDETEIDVPGWRNSRPVRIGNVASCQHQHAVYGDIFETAERFVECGNILDHRSADMLAQLATRCADHWRQMDSGIWELPEEQHYTNSKISCWQALARAVELADNGHIPATWRDRWARERDRVATWIDEHCWSEERQTYLAFPGSDMLDASIALAVRFRFGADGRMEKTIRALDRDLGAGPFHYRYSGVAREEACFLACTFWIIEAKALLGHEEEARRQFDTAIARLDHGTGIYAEMIDPETDAFLGNLPQGLTHLAVIQAASTLSGHPL
ncbi:glycoside hydrolase family 15 protein [Sphingomonas mucosissima]|uniref:Trehalase n=1 Tax=Sphingomonas mucosissima TaxID=370959 RepID=A0A245ZEY7_9SPHN|nr:glycoside hydrolase family 15 protein [Sphingomonas mucosissima]OWK28314.1 trehalase [Sphingomonas mucosissima]